MRCVIYLIFTLNYLIFKILSILTRMKGEVLVFILVPRHVLYTGKPIHHSGSSGFYSLYLTDVSCTVGRLLMVKSSKREFPFPNCFSQEIDAAFEPSHVQVIKISVEEYSHYTPVGNTFFRGKYSWVDSLH